MKRVWTIVVGLALVGAACGGDGGDADGVVSLDNNANQGTSTTEVQLDGEEALLEFSQCMRDEGIELPDIGVDQDGAPLLDPSLLDVIDIDSDEFQRAFDECQPILSSSGAFNVDIDPALQAQIEDQLVVFSQCMRDNGFEDFPDPTAVGSGLPYPISVLSQFSNPEFEDAIELCQRDLAFPGLDG